MLLLMHEYAIKFWMISLTVLIIFDISIDYVWYKEEKCSSTKSVQTSNQNIPTTNDCIILHNLIINPKYYYSSFNSSMILIL